MSLGGPDPAEGANSRDRRGMRRYLLPIAGIAVLVMAGALVLGHRNRAKPPPLATSCQTPALALSTTSVQRNHAVQWAATGPAGTKFVLNLGAAALVATGQPNTVRAVPDPGLTKANVEQASDYTTMPSSCKTSGQFGAKVDAGRTYNVRMFTLTHAGTTITATAVATKRLTVT